MEYYRYLTGGFYHISSVLTRICLRTRPTPFFSGFASRGLRSGGIKSLPGVFLFEIWLTYGVKSQLSNIRELSSSPGDANYVGRYEWQRRPKQAKGFHLVTPVVLSNSRLDAVRTANCAIRNDEPYNFFRFLPSHHPSQLEARALNHLTNTYLCLVSAIR
jgi:hypothetical protein